MSEIKINATKTGSHGIYWYAIFDQSVDQKDILARFSKALDTGTQIAVTNSLMVITDSMMRGIVQNEEVITGFPYLIGDRYEQCETQSITEWSQAHNLEAVISVVHSQGSSISFFCTDYAINSSTYKTKKEITINLIGLVYDLVDFDPEAWNTAESEMKFTTEFCGYLPRSEDEIEFIGHIKAVKKQALGEIDGFLLTIAIAPALSCEFFIAERNVSLSLELEKQVRGIAWMQGRLK